jgi:hypothetical protein
MSIHPDEELSFTRIYYQLDGRRRHWDITADPVADDNNTLKQHLAEWEPDAIYSHAVYHYGNGRKFIYQ